MPETPQADDPPTSDVDYYIDLQGNLVFTAHYHLKRGTCCGNKCRNCPYDWKNVDPSRISSSERRPPLDDVTRRSAS